MSKKQKLELTWIGKDERPKLEPRILIEDQSLSYCGKEQKPGDIFDNVLIKGDNLLALKALEHEYAGKVKCIYIDPPFNTQQAFEHYDDGVEHSLWLTLLRDRLAVLHRLLADDGSVFVHIDDNELGYLTCILDEVFGRSNKIGTITFKQSSASGPKAVNPGLVTTANYILYYAKRKALWKPNRVYAKRERDDRYNLFIENVDEPFGKWRFSPLGDVLARELGTSKSSKKKKADPSESRIHKFVIDNARSVVQMASIDPEDINENARSVHAQSAADGTRIYRAHREERDDIYFYGDKQVLFYSSKVRMIDGELVTGEALSNIWDDLLSNNVHKEGGVKFKNGKKPEALIKRVIELSSAPGDIVLDSFGGSGTTAAAAHKMSRRWLMVELGEHCLTHCVPRLKRVVDGTDLDGITTAQRWEGGGGFRYYTLAPSLLEKDKYDNWVISKKYDANMLAAAVCKLMGFTYEPSQDEREYWRHGHSTETDFIYVTTQSLTYDALKRLSEDVGRKRTLLVCCKAYNAKDDAFDNITLRKIPQVVLKKCEWGRDDYSLKIAKVAPPEEPVVANPPEPETEAAQAGTPKKRTRKPRRKPDADTTPDMFAKRVGA